MLIHSRELRTGLPGSCSDDRSLKTWVLWAPPLTCETLWSWFPITGGSIEEATRTAVVFFTKGLLSMVAKALGPFLILHMALFLGAAYFWVPVPFDVMALGFWSCTLLPLGTCFGAQTLSFRMLRNTNFRFVTEELCVASCVWLHGSNLKNTV